MSRGILVAMTLVTAVGCSTIFKAREAQKSIVGKARGEVPVTERLDLRQASLEQLVQFALTNRPSVVSARLAVQDARLALKALAADAPILSDTPWTAPKISLGVSHGESTKGMWVGSRDWRTSGKPSASVSLDLLLWDFGRYGAKAGEQAEKVVAAEMALVETGYSVFNEVAGAYFTFIEKRSLLEVAQTNRIQYAEHLARAEARLEAGEANRLDVLKARLDLANATQTLVAASNLVTTSGATLMNALGIEESRGTSDEVLGCGPMGIDAVRRGFPASSFAVDEAFDFARTNAPAMQMKRAQLRASSKAVDYAIADLMPTVSASTSLSWTDPLWYWKWGVSAAQSVFQGFRKTTAVDRAVVAMQSAATAVDLAEQQLSLELETAVANRDNSRTALMSAQVSVRSARENLDMIQEQLTVGDVSRIELSEAIAAYSKAMGDCIVSFYDGQRAEARLFALLGRYPEYKEEIVKETK